MKKIVIINPPVEVRSNFINYPFLPNLGVLITASILKKKCYSVKVIDSFFMEKRPVLDEKNGKIYFGSSLNKIIRVISKLKADVFIIGNNRFFDFDSQINDKIFRLFNLIKYHHPDSLNILADFYTAGYDYVDFDIKGALKKCSAIDVINFGESEYSLPLIIQKFFNKESFADINGVAYRGSGECIKINLPKINISNLDDLPYAALNYLNEDNYFLVIKELSCKGYIHEHRDKYRLLPLLSSRGCPYGCIFCSIYPYSKRKWRAHSADYILKEMAYFLKNYKIGHFMFLDENMNADIQRFDKIVSGMLKLNGKFSWSVPNGLRADKLNSNILLKMKKTGFDHLFISAESGVQRVLDEIVKKNLDLNSVLNVAKICKKIQMKLSIHYVIGFPGEKLKDIYTTLLFAAKLYREFNVFPLLQAAVPIKGTELYGICLKNRYFKLLPKNNDIPELIMQGGAIETRDFSSRQIKEIVSIFKNMIFSKK